MAEQTPLHQVELRAGATFTERAGWDVPAHFGSPVSDYRHALQNAAVFDLSPHGKLELLGKDARSFLHNLCTNDVNRLPGGAGCEAFLTSAQARIVGHAYVYRAGGAGSASLWLDLAPGQVERVMKHLDRYIISEQIELADRTRDFAQFHVAGPNAREVLERLAGEPLPELDLLGHEECPFGGISCAIRRREPLGLPGYDLLCPPKSAEALWQALVERGGVRPAGQDAYDILRVEAGTPVYGQDIDETNFPQEVGRTDQAVSFAKGCYIGQETVARIRTYGHVNRSLVGLRLTGSEPPDVGAALYCDGQEVGRVTSAARSPRFGTIALAYARRGSAEQGTHVEIGSPGGRPAEVTRLPFSPAGTPTA